MSLLALLAASSDAQATHVRTPALADYTPTTYLTVPSPAADDVYHPDVLDTVTGWNGYRYWMGFTPFPTEADENPCVVASHDGSTWVVPTGATNPIDAWPISTYNSDTDLILYQGLLYCTYREGAGLLRYRTSADGVNWSPEIVIGNIGSGSTLSPSYVRIGEWWQMWYLDNSGGLRRVQADSIDGPWSAPELCSVSIPEGYVAWHLDVIHHGAAYYGLIYAHQGASSPTNIIVGITSSDGTHWGESTDVLMQPNATFSQLYRATLQPAAGGFDVWMGATVTALGGRRLGRSFIPDAEFDGPA